MLTCSRMTIRSVQRHATTTRSSTQCCRARGPPRSNVGFLGSTTSGRTSSNTLNPPTLPRYYFTSANNTRTGWHTVFFQPSSEEEEKRRSRKEDMYNTNNIGVQLNRRFASTVTTPSSIESNTLRSDEAKTATSSTVKNESTVPPDNNNLHNSESAFQSSAATTDDDIDPHSAPSPTFRSNLRARYQAKRKEYKCRAEDYRDTARTHYQEFKEHPRQTARESAVSIRGMIQRYGPVFVGTYGTLYLSTLALLFGGVESGALDPVVLFQWLGQDGNADSTVQLVVEFMDKYEWTKPYAHVVERNPSVANLAVAWIAVKFTEPIRLGLSVAITPRLARYFGYTTTIEDEDDTAEEVDPRTQARSTWERDTSSVDQSKQTNHKV